MAVNEKRDPKRYRGMKGGVKRYFEAETSDGRRMGSALKEDFWNGAWMRKRGHYEIPFAAVPVALGCVFGGIGGLLAGLGEDYVVPQPENTAQIEQGIESVLLGQDAYQAFVSGRNHVPYMVISTDEGVSVYKAETNGDLGIRVMNYAQGWEWNLLDEEAAFFVLDDMVRYGSLAVEVQEGHNVLEEDDVIFRSLDFENVTRPYLEDDVQKISTTAREGIHQNIQTMPMQVEGLEYVQQRIENGAYTNDLGLDFVDLEDVNQNTIDTMHAKVALWSLGLAFGLMGSTGTLNAAHTAAFRRGRGQNKKGPRNGY